MNIVVLERNSVGVDIEIDMYEKFGEVTYYPNTVEAEVAKRVKDMDIAIINKAPMNELTLKEAKDLKLICLFSTGYDNVDLDYCRSRGIKVANVVNYSTDSVAQHTFALAFYLIEKLNFYDMYVKSGEYGSQSRFSNFDRSFMELEGKTWGIIGMGNIGKKVSKIATAFGCKVIFYSASGNNRETDYQRVDFDTLCEQSDVISIHCPLSDRTKNIMNMDAFGKMKKSAILINVARGPIVNEKDLAIALNEEMIAGAGLDVLEKEPISSNNPLNAIKDSTKLMITPHMAWASLEARQRVVMEVFNNMEAFLKGESRNILNEP